MEHPRPKPRDIATGVPAPRRLLLPSPPVPQPVPGAAARPPPRRELPGAVAGPGAPPAPIQAPRVSTRRVSEEPPHSGVDPLEALLGDPWLRRASDRPIVVLAERPSERRYEYLELLKRVVREIYRVSSRAPPLVQHVARRLTEYQLAMMRGGAAIYVIDVDAVEEAEAGGAALSRLVNALEDRLREAYAQGFGFLVVYGSRGNLQRVRRLWRPSLSAGGALYTLLPRPVEVSVPESPEAFKLVEAVYGVRPGSLGDAESLDEAVIRAEDMLYTCLESFANDPSLGRLTRPAIDEEEARPDDAFTHYALKAAAVAHLLEAGFRESSIDTEVAVSNIPVDVLARRGWGGGFVVEAETLSGTLNPASRLAALVKRINTLGYSVWVVLLPHTASIYKPVIEPLARESEKYGSSEFYVLSPASCSLLPLEEHYARVDEAAEKLAGTRAATPSILARAV